MSVRGVDRFPDRVRPPDGVEAVEAVDRLPELLGLSDFAVIAAPHTPETQGLFDARILAHLRPSSFLINIGRGAIVVLDDLVAALRAGKLAGAALDVYEIEPLPARPPALGFSQRDPDPAYRRLFAGDRRAAPGGAGRKRGPVRSWRAARERRGQSSVVLGKRIADLMMTHRSRCSGVAAASSSESSGSGLDGRARGAPSRQDDQRARHRLHQGWLGGAQARPGAASRGRRAVSGGRRDPRRGLAPGEQGRCPADPAAVCPAGICRDLTPVPFLPQGRVPRAGS